MKRKFKVATILIFVFLVVSCETTVRFDSNVQGAEVYLDGVPAGETPFTKEMTNAIWEDPTVTVKKEGYEDYNGKLEREVKLVPAVVGFLASFWVWLWAYGPSDVQSFDLIKN